MTKARPGLATLLDRIERAYGPQRSAEPRDAYELLLHRMSGYPQSAESCARGFRALKTQIGLAPEAILGAKLPHLQAALREGGIVPELRAQRMREVAKRVRDEFGGDLGAVLARPAAEARRILASFPTVAVAGAEKILLFTRTAPLAAVPSNCVHVPVRLGYGRPAKSWSTSYRTAQAALAAELPERFDDRMRAFLLLRRLGTEVCKLSNPRCDRCPVATLCPYYAGIAGRGGRAPRGPARAR